MKLYGIYLKVWDKCIIESGEVNTEKETAKQYQLPINSGAVFNYKLRMDKGLLNQVVREREERYYWSTEPININEVSKILKDDLIKELDKKINELQKVKDSVLSHSL